MQKATTETLYFETGPQNAPTMRVLPGERFQVQTQLNRGPWLNNHPDGGRLRRLLRGGNPSSGAVYIEGAQPGQALHVHIESIDVDPLGFTRYSGSTGAMPGWMGDSGVGPAERIVEIRGETIHWGGGRTLPLRPMLGFVGVSPERETFHNGWGGNWGGNFDLQEIAPGAEVILPVYVEGALLHVGDMHAIQGDGEICGAGGIEASGTAVLRCELSAKPAGMVGPRVIDETHIMAVAMAKPAEDAFRHALSALILWLEADYGFSRKEAYLWLGQTLEARCTQFVNPTFTYVAKIRKSFLPEPASRLTSP